MLRAVTGWSIRRPKTVLVLWLVAVAVMGSTGFSVFGRLLSDVGLVPGSESDRAYTMMSDAPSSPTLTAVIAGPATGTSVNTPTQTAAADLRQLPGITHVSEPQPSPVTANVFLLTVAFDPGSDAKPAAQAAAQRLHHISGATVTVAGGPLTDSEFNTQAQSDVQRAEMLTTPVVLLLLLIIFGGLVAAGLPLILALVGAVGTFGVLYAISTFTDVSVYAIQVATMLSVGLAVDYGLLIVNRYREEKAIAADGALARAATTAGRTVAYSGLTVAAVLAGLLVFPDPFLRSMGFSGIAVVAVVVIAALTLLPALLALAGRRITPAKPAPARGGTFAAIARGVQRRPLITTLAAAGAMVVLTLPVLDLQLGQVDARLLPDSTQTRQLHDAIAAHFPALNRPNPIIVVAAADTGSTALATLRTQIDAVPGVTATEIARTGPTTVLHAQVSQPAHSQTTRQAVTAIRALPAPFDMAVTGEAAMLIDYQTMLQDRLPYAVTVILLGTLVLLFLFTGSVILPIKAVLTNMLSIGAALGVVVWVFQQGHLAAWFGTMRLDTTHLSVPVLVGAIAFGLSVDYEVFLLSRIREQWQAGSTSDRAVAEGLQHTGRIITSAALLLVIVFAGFLTAGFVPVKAIGLGLVLAVALDATIVRLLLVPATMTMFGRYNWWAPRPLRRVHDRLHRPHATANSLTSPHPSISTTHD